MMFKAVVTASVLLAASFSAKADTKSLIVAEPTHGVGYLPLYVAIDEGYFKQLGLDVKFATMEGGSAHTNAVLSGQAFAFIGGPEHNAFADLGGKQIRAVVNVVDRGNVYLVAAAGKGPKDADIAAWAKNKVMAPGLFGGTPNSITRYMLTVWGLEDKKDATILETTTPGILAAIKTGQAQIAAVSEPMLTQGIGQGIWDEPFFNVPKELGPYAYSTMNVLKDQIDKDPQTVEAFVKGVIMGLREVYDHPDEAQKIAEKEFPTMPPDGLKATLARTFADELWSHDGMVSQQAWITAEKVVRNANILKADVPYDNIIDMQFVRAVLASNK
ncbi:MAG TPA: ABC transporter substrate-binding protein [Stellaceae bacterium]|jgi:NitT/TauT family transport system substrate-binding protein|nr:ABC transporter substrate-binding protein [Stellaceae bacterium]